MRYKGFIIPRKGYISRLRAADITSRAKVKLSWMDYYQKNKNVRLTCRHFGISPDTFYRWKKRYRPKNLKSLEDNPKTRRPYRLRIPTTPVIVVNRILQFRETYPRWGKEKIAVLLKREGFDVSVSTVGRTIKRLKDRLILKEPKPNYISSKKRYLKRAWAVRKPGNYSIRYPGDLVQIDTLDVRPIPGIIRKQFTARDVISRWDVIEAYSTASALRAAFFLDTLIKRAPFKILAIQIDGGSEFKGEFEAECCKRNIRLFVLPPRSPKLNGYVERSNRTHTEEFYEVNDFSFDLLVLNQQLRDWEEVYNTIRPHQSLNYLTPLEYINQWKKLTEGCVRDVLD
jgi:transposase InsO family protein